MVNNKILKQLGQKLKEKRKIANLTQEQLAELINKTRNYVGMVERAEINVPVLVIFDIAKALNVHPKEFFEF